MKTGSKARRRGRAATPELEDVATRLHSLAIHLIRHAWARDSEMGLSRARASALSVLVFGGPCTLGELAAAEHVTPATMSRLVDALEADGYIERKPHPTDARALRLVATAAAKRVLEQGRALRVEAMREILWDLNVREQATVAQAVEVLEKALVVAK